MKVAALDLGSNTFLCLICEVKDHKITDIYADEVEVVRLGQGLNQNKKFHPEALQRAQETLTRFKKVIDLHQPERILAMATSAARDADNKHELFNICQNLNIPLQIISGDQEAEITYSGSVSGQEPNKSQSILVVDIGGGSTEFIFGKGLVLTTGLSQNIGCVRMTEKYNLADTTGQFDLPLQIKKCRDEVRQSLLNTQERLNSTAQEILAVAGTPTALVVAELGVFDKERIDGYQLTQEKLNSWFEKLKNSTLEEKWAFGIPPGRADVILVGVIILQECLNVFKHHSITVSTRGVRYGIALFMEKHEF